MPRFPGVRVRRLQSPQVRISQRRRVRSRHRPETEDVHRRRRRDHRIGSGDRALQPRRPASALHRYVRRNELRRSSRTHTRDRQQKEGQDDHADCQIRRRYGRRHRTHRPDRRGRQMDRSQGVHRRRSVDDVPGPGKTPSQGQCQRDQDRHRMRAQGHLREALSRPRLRFPHRTAP